MSSRIPVFIERSSRKGWNRTAEHCIFIACESLETSDIDESGSSEVERNDTISMSSAVPEHCLENNSGLIAFSNESHLVKPEVSSKSGKTIETKLSVDASSVLFKEKSLLDKVELSDADESWVQNDDDSVKSNAKVVENSIEGLDDDTLVSISVVSCARGIVTSSCNCNADKIQHFSTMSGCEKAMFKSHIPSPKLLRPGRVAITPTPVKRGRKSQIQTNILTNINKETKEEKREKVAIKETKSKSEVSEHSPEMLDNLAKSCTESCRSLKEFEDSEPEHAQHEKERVIINGWRRNESKLTGSGETNINTSSVCKQDVCGGIEEVGVCSGQGHSQTAQNGWNANKGIIKCVKSVSPMSRLPVFRYKKQTSDQTKAPHEDKDNLTGSGLKNQFLSSQNNSPCKSSAVEVFTSKENNVKQTNSRKNISFRNTFKGSNRHSPQNLKTMDARRKEVNINRECKTTSTNNTYGFKNQCLDKGVDLSGIHETRTSKLRKQKHSPKNTVNSIVENQSWKTVESRKTSLLIPRSHDLTNGRRNLPTTPAQVRTVKYGQCVFMDEDKNTSGTLESDDTETGFHFPSC